MAAFWDFLNKIIPIGRAEVRERFCELNQQIATLQKQLETIQLTFSKSMRQVADWHALRENERFKEQERWQQTILAEQLRIAFEKYAQREDEVLEAQRQWAESVLHGQRDWQEAAMHNELSHAFENHTVWEREVLEAQRQWQETVLLNLLETIRCRCEEISKETKTFYWDNAYEKGAVIANWGDLSVDPDFEKKYLNLIRGLDEVSIQTVNKILCHQKHFLSDSSAKIDLFTFEEQEELRKIEDTFSKEILQVSPNLFAYKQYLLPINCFEPVVFYYKYCIDEIANLEQLKGKTIIDAGAFIGDTALIFSELNPDRIISFEPVPENIELLKKTIALNNMTNVTVEQMALGAETGSLTMHICGMGSTHLPREEDKALYEEEIELPVITLDEYVDEHHLQIGLIKADIEGSEPDFLQGARRVITEQRPVLMICIYHNKHDFFEIKSLLEEWDLGYKFKIRKPTVVNSTYETLLIAEPQNIK